MGVVERICIAASAELEQVLQSRFPNARQVSPVLLKHFSAYGNYTQGWQMTLPISGSVIFVLKPITYPARVIDIFVANCSHVGQRPHVFAQGFLCLAPPEAQHYPANHVQSSLERIAKADVLLNQPLSMIPIEEWATEIRAYWRTSAYRIVSLLTADGPSRRIVSAVYDDQIYVADNATYLQAWLNRRYGMQRKWSAQHAVLLWLDKPLGGPPYPTTVKHLLELTLDASLLLPSLVAQRPTPTVVILGWSMPDQPVLLGIMLEHGLEAWQQVYTTTKLVHLLPRIADVLPPRLVRCDVQRADGPWIAFRGGRMDIGELRTQRVALLGCGSLGSGVAELLAKSGVGDLTLVDPQYLMFDNIGRSTNGAEEVGQNKADALKAKIERALPHIKCTAVPRSWMTIANKLSTFDLIISTMGIWNENMLLNRIAIESSARPIIFGWLEPHALAAHAVCILTAHACIECGFSADGRPKLVATTWDNETRQGEPGCGGMFQPYGAVDLAPAYAIVAELALDTLASHVSETTRRTWLGNTTRLTALGGRWNTIWEAQCRVVGEGRMVVDTRWPNDPVCPACGYV